MMSFWMDIRKFFILPFTLSDRGELLMVLLIGLSLRAMLLRLLFICSASLLMSLLRLWMAHANISQLNGLLLSLIGNGMNVMGNEPRHSMKVVFENC